MPTETRPARILLVDADASSLRALGSLLQEVGHVVGMAAGWQDALELARADHYELVIADLELPGESVADAVVSLSSDPALRELPIILLSRRGGSAAWRAGLSIVDSMAKPINVGRMLASIDRHAHVPAPAPV